MSRRFRQTALLIIFVFMANVQAWAITMEDEIHHDGSTSSHSVTQQSENQQPQSHDCERLGNHCCHNINHLLGQVSDGLILSGFFKESNLFLMVDANATSTDPEDFYRPPRTASLT